MLKLFLFFFAFSFINASTIQVQETAKVLWVVDGDTLKVEYKAKEESIRLIGIDTPESRINKKAKRDSTRNKQDIETIIDMGKKATKFVRTLVKLGDTISIEFDVQKRDGIDPQ